MGAKVHTFYPYVEAQIRVKADAAESIRTDINLFILSTGSGFTQTIKFKVADYSVVHIDKIQRLFKFSF